MCPTGYYLLYAAGRVEFVGGRRVRRSLFETPPSDFISIYIYMINFYFYSTRRAARVLSRDVRAYKSVLL